MSKSRFGAPGWDPVARVARWVVIYTHNRKRSFAFFLNADRGARDTFVRDRKREGCAVSVFQASRTATPNDYRNLVQHEARLAQRGAGR